MIPSSPSRFTLARLLAAALLAPLAPAAIVVAPSAALAQPSSADKETARNLMKEGDAKFAAKDYAGALKAYQAAHAIMQVPSTGLPLAKTQIERGLLVEARDTLLQVSRHPKEANEPAAYAKAREEAAQLAQKIAPRIPSLVIVIEGASADEAAVAVDGSAVPAAALGSPRKVNPGSHTITASATGYRDASATLDVKEGENEKVTLKLVSTGGSAPALAPTPGPAVKGGGRLRVESPAEPGNVFVDGKASGVTPLEVSVAPGAHKIEIEYPGGTHEEKRIAVDAGKTEVVSFQPSPMDAVARHRKWVHVGVTAGPAMAVFLDGGALMFGGTGGFVLNVGITPTFDFRTGATATVVHRFDDDLEGQITQVSAVVPAMLRVNWSPWFSSAAGLSAGFVADLQLDGPPYGASIGPEWTLLSMAAGDKRQYELAFSQGLRFGQANKDFHQSVVFTYLFLD
ncbi:PEGA domain-containing protein [Polyangium aurulentum]|uniref:PEGA domain-containing protein n=1 Tax=Polyangium aurulentum TaxID=2567896 RepID=UPI00200E8720|nr:PEGA domain-containing protein [Polyangium aurulentum]UQA58949.1 PEGA domain-containing protein [Polyangium aurulentum]